MSKSLGNTYTLDQLQEKGIEPLAYKLFCYTAHYRTKLNFTFDSAISSQKALNRLRRAYQEHEEALVIGIPTNEIQDYKKRFLEAVNDDLNMPLAMGIIWEIARKDIKAREWADLLLDFDKVLALDLENSKSYLEEEKKIELPEEIQKWVEERKIARQNKDWEKSDELRDKIIEAGYIVKDTKEGMTVEKG